MGRICASGQGGRRLGGHAHAHSLGRRRRYVEPHGPLLVTRGSGMQTHGQSPESGRVPCRGEGAARPEGRNPLSIRLLKNLAW